MRSVLSLALGTLVGLAALQAQAKPPAQHAKQSSRSYGSPFRTAARHTPSQEESVTPEALPAPTTPSAMAHGSFELRHAVLDSRNYGAYFDGEGRVPAQLISQVGGGFDPQSGDVVWGDSYLPYAYASPYAAAPYAFYGPRYGRAYVGAYVAPYGGWGVARVGVGRAYWGGWAVPYGLGYSPWSYGAPSVSFYYRGGVPAYHPWGLQGYYYAAPVYRARRNCCYW